jgi:hypothetical protein
MDTLCVPVGMDHEDLRIQTINQMRQIYEDADRVLVLDDWVEELSVSSSIYEKAVRIRLCNWQHRLWTLQEAVLAQQLCIQFRDGQRSMEQIQDEGHLTQGPRFYDFTGAKLSDVPMFNIYFLQHGQKQNAPSMDSLFSLLIHAIDDRMTTKFEDETVCLATVLRLDTKTLQKVSTGKRDKMTAEEKAAEEAKICDARMERFLGMVGSFQQRIIFNKLSRLRKDGFRWAPRSFLGQSRPTLVDRNDVAWDMKSRYPPARILTDTTSPDQGNTTTGLIVTYPGIRLERITPAQLQVGTFCMSQKSNNEFRYRVRLEIPIQDDDDDDNESTWVHENGEYALVTSDVLGKTFCKPMPCVFGMLRGQTKSGIHKLRHLCLATVEAADQQGTQSELAMGILLDSEENQWCIL